MKLEFKINRKRIQKCNTHDLDYSVDSAIKIVAACLVKDKLGRYMDFEEAQRIIRELSFDQAKDLLSDFDSARQNMRPGRNADKWFVWESDIP